MKTKTYMEELGPSKDAEAAGVVHHCRHRGNCDLERAFSVLLRSLCVFASLVAPLALCLQLWIFQNDLIVTCRPHSSGTNFLLV